MHNNEESNPFYIALLVIIIVALIIAILIGEESKRREDKCNCNCPTCMEKHGEGNKSKPIFYYPLFLNNKLK